jgi:putative nucleotidyltransferase with HDIG domain
MNDRENNTAIKEQFIDAVKFFAGSLSSLRLYPPTHPSVTKSINDLLRSFKTLIGEENHIVIAVARNIPVLDGVPIYEKNVHLESFIKLTKSKKIEIIIVKSGIKEEELVSFLTILKADDDDPDALNLSQTLEKNNVKNILIKDLNFDERARETYFNAIDTIAQTLEDVRMGNKLNVYENKRVVKGIVNSILVDKNAILPLTMIKNFNDYLFSHSVNVCILSASLAEELGYTEDLINEIGLSGLLHDIGKLKTPKDILLKPGKLDDSEWEVMRKHPTFGSQILSELQGISQRTAKMVYEHHMRPNPKGYPKPAEGQELLVGSQIIAIADTYDASTTLRPYQNPLTPIEAIKKMRKMTRENKDFNTEFLDLFSKMVGAFPIGATVRLDTNELATISRYHAQKSAPVVKIFMDKDGAPLDDVIDADLNDVDQETGKPLRSIVAEVDTLARNLDMNRILSHRMRS